MEERSSKENKTLLLTLIVSDLLQQSLLPPPTLLKRLGLVNLLILAFPCQSRATPTIAERELLYLYNREERSPLPPSHRVDLAVWPPLAPLLSVIRRTMLVTRELEREKLREAAASEEEDVVGEGRRYLQHSVVTMCHRD